MANTNLPHNQGLSLAGLNQSTSCAVGAQQGGTINQFDSNGLLTDVAVTFPAAVLVAQIDVADATASYTFVVPFKCKVIAVNGVKHGAGGAGDEITVVTVDLGGTTTPLTSAISLAAGTDTQVFGSADLDLASATVDAGATIGVAATKAAGSPACTLFVSVLPVG